MGGLATSGFYFSIGFWARTNLMTAAAAAATAGQHTKRMSDCLKLAAKVVQCPTLAEKATPLNVGSTPVWEDS